MKIVFFLYLHKKTARVNICMHSQNKTESVEMIVQYLALNTDQSNSALNECNNKYLLLQICNAFQNSTINIEIKNETNNN